MSALLPPGLVEPPTVPASRYANQDLLPTPLSASVYTPVSSHRRSDNSMSALMRTTGGANVSRTTAAKRSSKSGMRAANESARASGLRPATGAVSSGTSSVSPSQTSMPGSSTGRLVGGVLPPHAAREMKMQEANNNLFVIISQVRVKSGLALRRA